MVKTHCMLLMKVDLRCVAEGLKTRENLLKALSEVRIRWLMRDG